MNQQLTSSAMRYNKQTLQYGNEAITYQVFFIPNQKPKIVIDVLPNGAVQVKAPESVTLKDIKLAVHRRARWIHNHIKKFNSNMPMYCHDNMSAVNATII